MKGCETPTLEPLPPAQQELIRSTRLTSCPRASLLLTPTSGCSTSSMIEIRHSHTPHFSPSIDNSPITNARRSLLCLLCLAIVVPVSCPKARSDPSQPSSNNHLGILPCVSIRPVTQANASTKSVSSKQHYIPYRVMEFNLVL